MLKISNKQTAILKTKDKTVSPSSESLQTKKPLFLFLFITSTIKIFSFNAGK